MSALQVQPVSLTRRILRLAPSKALLLVEAACWLCIARVALRCISFPRLAAYVGKLQPPSRALEPADSPEHVALARRVAQAVHASAVNAPVEMVCLPRALAAWQMLHWRGVHARLHFGKPPRSGEQQDQPMHAWLTSAGVEVTGYPIAYDCVELGYFARPQKHTGSR